MKSILYSCSPERARKILNGEATLDIRKSVPKDFEEIIKEQGGIWVYMYVTKGKPYLMRFQGNVRNFIMATTVGNGLTYSQRKSFIQNGKIVARWWFDEYDTYYLSKLANEYTSWKYGRLIRNTEVNLDLCLDDDEINDYGNGKDLYAWHIKRLGIFDKPMELGEFYTKIPFFEDGKWTKEEYERAFGKWALMDKLEMNKKRKLTKAPQSWQYVWVKG